MRKATLACIVILLEMIAQSAIAQNWKPNGPLPRVYHSAVLDPSTKRMIIFGGFPADTTSMLDLNDVWRLLPSASLGGVQSWVAVNPSGMPPAPRLGHSAAYDAATNRMIVFGGTTNAGCTNDVWVLTNANGSALSGWSELSPQGGGPTGRAWPGNAYDPGSHTLMVYGGNDCSPNPTSDYWVLSHADGVSGTPTWAQLSPLGVGPGPRAELNAVYDPASNKLILFGGNDQGTFYNDVWVLTNANGIGGSPVWTQLSPMGTLPTARHNASATYDPVSNRMTVFGGDNTTLDLLLGDTWVLTNANGLGGTPAWTQIAQSSVDFPFPRFGHTAVYDPATNVMTVFGGRVDFDTVVTTNDVFTLSDANGK
jgi:hypothetical protein